MTERTPHDDPTLKSLLRASSPAPPLDDVDWSALHARTIAGAAPLLRRRAATWWQVLGNRSSPHGLRTAALAASIVLILAMSVIMPERPSSRTYEAEFRTIEEELALSVPYASVPLLAAEADNRTVIDALLLYDREEW